MNHALRILTTLLLGLCLTACGGDSTGNGAGDPHAGEAAHDHEGEHDHDAPGPHGGAVTEVGADVAHLEAVHDDVLGQVTVYVMDLDDGMLELDADPVLNVVTDSGSAQVKPTAVGGAWVFEHDALTGHPERARFRLVLGGKTYTVDMPCSHDHEADEHDDHGHEHGDEGHGDEHEDHGPHDGVVQSFADGLGHLELKLHDDKGDLELWLAKDEAISEPYDLPLDAKLTVTFLDHGDREVSLAVRNRERNEDEDGTPNLRDGKTNYFIFPGDSGADASWLMGADFVSKVTVKIEADGKTFVTQPFELRPHTHGAEDHDH